MAFPASAAQAAGTPSFNAAGAPTGTHVQTGIRRARLALAPRTSRVATYELAGVGNARATLTATYRATHDCRNNGGQVVETTTVKGRRIVHRFRVPRSAPLGDVGAIGGMPAGIGLVGALLTACGQPAHGFGWADWACLAAQAEPRSGGAWAAGAIPVPRSLRR
jgi:hypothetical protein